MMFLYVRPDGMITLRGNVVAFDRDMDAALALLQEEGSYGEYEFIDFDTGGTLKTGYLAPKEGS
jgi:hypothetical protein